MKLLRNTGTDRVIDLVAPELRAKTLLDVVSPSLSLLRIMPGGTHALMGEFDGINDFEVVAYLVVLSEKGKDS